MYVYIYIYIHIKICRAMKPVLVLWVAKVQYASLLVVRGLMSWGWVGPYYRG